MAGTPTRFRLGRRTITVSETSEHIYTVTVRGPGIRVLKKKLSSHSASRTIILAAGGRRGALSRSIRTVPRFHVITKVTGLETKAVGVDWMSLRLLAGARPIILKVPMVFGGNLLYIEPTEDPDEFTMRLVNPHTDQRTEPSVVSRTVALEAINTFPHGESTGPTEHGRHLG